MAWWQRLKKNVETSTDEKLETPDGIWQKCSGCKKALLVHELRLNHFICPKCGQHERMDAVDYFNLLFDQENWTELLPNLKPRDSLQFVDMKAYQKRIEEATVSSGLKEAMRVAEGKCNDQKLVIAAMDFKFIAGSMGSVMGEKIARAIDRCLETRSSLLIISKSGGARMQESALSLMQMAKTSSKLTQLAEARLPYISLLTHPTTGGVTASFAMLGDLNIAEPSALIGFAGPRVIEETIKKKLPEGFQTSEFQLENGFLDCIVERKNLKDTISRVIRLLDS